VVPGGSAFNTARHAARWGSNVGILAVWALMVAMGFYGGWAALRYQYAAHAKEGFTGTLLVRHEQGKETCGVLQTWLAVT